MSAVDLKARLDRGEALTLVDVREPQESDINTIPGSIIIPAGELERRAASLDRSRDVVLYCKAGVRSAAAVLLLKAAGFPRVAHLKGGILGWIDEVDPEQPTY